MPDSREVFKLRKEGRVQEALELARTLFEETPQDEWLIRAYGWTLHDCLKSAQQNGETELMAGLLAEFEHLNIADGGDDAKLRSSRENWRGRVPPDGGGPALTVLIQQAKEQSDQGNRKEALRILRNAVREFPNLAQASISLAWEIERALKDVVSQETIDGQAVRALLLEYRNLAGIEKPGLLHSMILTRATQAAESFSTYIAFLRWWDPSYFREEDFQRYAPAGAEQSYDSLMERVIRAVHKASKNEKNADTISWAAEFVGQNYTRFPEQEWFEYYYGQLLVQTGELIQARELLIPIVRRKQGEFWAWDNLAATYGVEDTEKKMACLCRALMCQTKDKSFLVNVHSDLGRLLVQQKMFGEAKYEIGMAVAIKEANNWKQSQELRDWQASSWYQTAAALQSNKDLYSRHAPFAEAMLYAGLPEIPGVVMQHLPPRDDKPGLTFVGYMKNGELVEVGIKAGRFAILKEMSQGCPMSLQIDDSGQHPIVVSISKREGAPWDLLPDRVGVVRHVNAEKGVTAVALGRDEFCLFHHDRFPEMAKIAPGVTVAIKVRHDEKRDILRALAWNRTEDSPSSSFCKEFEGIVEVNDSGRYGFVNHGIYVSPELIEQSGLANGDTIKGRAIAELNKKKNEYGWRAITANKVIQ